MGFPSITCCGILPQILKCKSITLRYLLSLICRTLLMLVFESLTHGTSCHDHDHDHDLDDYNDDALLQLTNNTVIPRNNSFQHHNMCIDTKTSSTKAILSSLPVLLLEETTLFSSNIIQSISPNYVHDNIANFNNIDFDYQSISTMIDGHPISPIFYKVHYDDQVVCTTFDNGRYDDQHIIDNNFLYDDQLMCAICLSQLHVHQKVRQLPLCSHVFHVYCIDSWFYHGQFSCPLCRISIADL